MMGTQQGIGTYISNTIPTHELVMAVILFTQTFLASVLNRKQAHPTFAQCYRRQSCAMGGP